VVERKVDGVAIMTSESDPDLLADLTRRNIPTVFMDTGKPGPHCANIRIDYGQGIQEAVHHLVTLNHRRIAFITGPMNLASAQTRCSVFISSLKAHGIFDPTLIEKGNHRIEGGAMAMKAFLKLPRPPTAVIASNDLTAIGALGTVHQMGLRVPEDVSLIGFDDIAFAHLTNPPLTTVVLSRRQLATLALAALDALIQGKRESVANLTIPTHLVLRNSTRSL
jgi:DNA-binding LacI/PurR family transcriptional regulator